MFYLPLSLFNFISLLNFLFPPGIENVVAVVVERKQLKCGGGGGGGRITSEMWWWWWWWRGNKRNVVAVVVYSFTIHEAVLQKKLGVGSM